MNMKIVLPVKTAARTSTAAPVTPKGRVVTTMPTSSNTANTVDTADTPVHVVAPTLAAPKVTFTEVDKSEVRTPEPVKAKHLPMTVLTTERGPAPSINNVLPVDADVAALPSMGVMRQSVLDFQQANPNVKFIYVRAQFDTENGLSRYGGLTIAWMFDNAARGLPIYSNTVVVRVSTAWCNPREQFNKVIGRYMAMKEFKAGHYARMQLKNPNLLASAGLPGSYENQLRTIFSTAL